MAHKWILKVYGLLKYTFAVESHEKGGSFLTGKATIPYFKDLLINERSQCAATRENNLMQLSGSQI